MDNEAHKGADDVKTKKQTKEAKKRQDARRCYRDLYSTAGILVEDACGVAAKNDPRGLHDYLIQQIDGLSLVEVTRLTQGEGQQKRFYRIVDRWMDEYDAMFEAELAESELLDQKDEERREEATDSEPKSRKSRRSM